MHQSTQMLDKIATLALISGADAADAVCFQTVDVGLSCRHGRQEGLERSESEVVNLRVFIGSSQAIVSSTDCSPEAITRLVEHAVAMARATPPDALAGLANPEIIAKSIPDLDLCEVDEPSVEWLFSTACEAEETALSTSGITNSEGADASYSRSQIALAVGRAGRIEFLQHYQTSHSSLSVSVLAGTGTDMQRDYDFSTARHRANLRPAITLGATAASRALARMNPRKINSAIWPVIYDPRVARSLLSSFAACINGASVVRGSTFLKNALNTAVFSPAITIVDDPTRLRGLASKPFDGEAVLTAPRTLVEKGTLKSWVLDVRSANALGLTSTGHATRGVGSPPSPSSSNLYIEAGIASRETLFKQMGTGLYITETFGTGINHITGDYSQGASGFWIEGGDIAYPVAEITVAGHLRDMFARMVAADDLEFRYATNAPSLLVDGMTIAGA